MNANWKQFQKMTLLGMEKSSAPELGNTGGKAN